MRNVKMSIRKVCPKCKDCDEVTETAFPAERYTRSTLSPVRDKNHRIVIDWHEIDVEEEWSEFNDFSPAPIYVCSKCGYTYEGDSYDEIWNEMIWRKIENAVQMP